MGERTRSCLLFEETHFIKVGKAWWQEQEASWSLA